MKITSLSNQTVKDTSKLLQKKYRDEQGLFILEGIKSIEEAIKSNLEICRIFVEENYKPNLNCECEIYEVTPAILGKISESKTPPKIVAVAKKIKSNIDDIKDMKRILLLDSIKDAGNLGTIIRTSAAFDIEGIILYGDTVDLYNPKCVRSAVGNLWKTKVFEFNSIDMVKTCFKDFEKIATILSARNIVNLKDYKPSKRTLIMFGAEATGLSNELRELADINLRIEMVNTVESLNLAISTGIILYHIYTN